jgi:Uma2 family endonuclease
MGDIIKVNSMREKPMAVQKIAISLEEFERLTELPENRERRFEFIDGEMIEVPSNPLSSEIASFIIAALVMFVRPRKLGHVTGEGAGYMVEGRVLSPDVAFVRQERQAEMPYKGFNPIAPDLAVEVVSATDEQPEIRTKLAIYAKGGVLVWLVYPERRIVEVYAPHQPVRIVEQEGVLEAPEILPGFTLAVRDIFPE